MKEKKNPYWLILPQLALSMIFLYGIANGLAQSFGIMPSLGLDNMTLKYYRELFAREDFVSSLLFSVHIAFLSAFLSVLIGVFACALLVRAKKTGGRTLRIIQLPIIIPHIVVAFFIIHFFSQNGILARLLYHAGLIAAQEEFALLVFDRGGIGIILGYLWKEVPFIIYFVMSLMQAVDERLGEAAVNLGASKAQSFFRITLPLCMPTIVGGFMILFTYALGAYELPFILGATRPKALPILAYMEYTHPDLHNRPYAMAVNGVIIALTLLPIGLWSLYGRKNEDS